MGTKISTVALQVLFVVLFVFCLGCPTNPPSCVSGMDVRYVNDSATPDWVKEEILWNSGAVIGKFRIPEGGGDPEPNPLYPSGRIVVIRVAPADWPANTAATTDYIDRIFFRLNLGFAPPVRSVAGYYVENSYGDFLPSKGGVPDWVSLGNLSIYGDVESSGSFLLHTLRSADVNWAALDSNSDGAISRAEAQIVYLIPNGTMTSGYASMRLRTIGSAPTPAGWYNFGTRPIIYFSLMAESAPDSHTNPIRYHASVIHELHHAFFALPDRYGANTGTGPYDHMTVDRNWIHLTMHDKIKIGWIQPKVINTHLGQCLRFPPSETTAAALVLVKPDHALVPAEPLEYWVVEHRNRADSEAGFDDGFPEDGLAVWYVCEGTYSSGHDDVRLVNASLPDQDPDLYNNPGYGALFRLNPNDPKRLLIDSDGEWAFLFFQDVSDPGQYVYGEF